MQPDQFIVAIFKFVILLFSLSVHECAHAWTASRLGDQTARMQGRVTLNPIPHIDPIGTLLLPAIIIFAPMLGLRFLSGMLIGWAKPTPVITRNFRNIVRDDTLVTLAGPASNLLIAFGAFLSLAVMIFMTRGGLPEGSLSTNLDALFTICSLAIQINLMLFFFNLLPIPPLDGSHILRHFLPYNMLNGYDRLGGTLGWVLMIFVGAPIVGLLLVPALHLVDFALRLVPGS